MDELMVDKLQFFGKKIFAGVSLAIAILFTIPTVAIMASWNSLPGEKLYPAKRYLENIALKLVGNNFTVRADLQTQFVEQRFNEAESLLAQSSSSGLNDLAQQIRVTKTDIIAARDREGGKDAIIAQQKAEKLSIQLKEYNRKLEGSKRTNVPNPGESTAQLPGANNSVKSSILPGNQAPIATPTSTPQPSDSIQGEDPIDTVDDLQDEIEETIEELKTIQSLNQEKIDEDSNGKEGKDGKEVKNGKDD